MTAAAGSMSPARLTPRRAAVLLAAVTLAVFATTLSAGFVYDARMQILTDPFLHDPRNWLPVLTFGVLRMDVLDFNRPVNLASLMLDAALWGKAPFGYHLTSVLLHTANVLLAWQAVRRLAPGLGSTAGITAALFFAVHPVVTEAVCEPTFREDLLATAFTLVGLVLALGRPMDGRGDGWRSAACIAACLLAVGSKESGVAAPAAIAACWLLVRRGDRGRFWPTATAGGTLVVVAFLGARFLLEPTPSRIFAARPQYPGGSLAAALLLEPRILGLYVQLVLLPVNLCADYGLYSVTHLPLPAAAALLLAVAGAAALAIRADRRMGLAFVLIVAPLLPVSNLIPIYRAAADRYLYMPMAGIAIGIGLFLDGPWLARRETLRDRLLAGLVAATILLGVACMERQRVWANSIALWTDTVRKNPVAATAAMGLAEALLDAGRLAESEAAARRGIELTGGGHGEAWATLALVLEAQGRSPEAFAAVDKAVQLDARLADPDARVGVLAMEHEYAAALKRLLKRRAEAD
jgi:tetratricopeptide (TPR) repeat protein